MPIGTSDGNQYADEFDLAIGKPMQATPADAGEPTARLTVTPKPVEAKQTPYTPGPEAMRGFIDPIELTRPSEPNVSDAQYAADARGTAAARMQQATAPAGGRLESTELWGENFFNKLGDSLTKLNESFKGAVEGRLPSRVGYPGASDELDPEAKKNMELVSNVALTMLGSGTRIPLVSAEKTFAQLEPHAPTSSFSMSVTPEEEMARLSRTPASELTEQQRRQLQASATWLGDIERIGVGTYGGNLLRNSINPGGLFRNLGRGSREAAAEVEAAVTQAAQVDPLAARIASLESRRTELNNAITNLATPREHLASIMSEHRNISRELGDAVSEQYLRDWATQNPSTYRNTMRQAREQYTGLRTEPPVETKRKIIEFANKEGYKGTIHTSLKNGDTVYVNVIGSNARNWDTDTRMIQSLGISGVRQLLARVREAYPEAKYIEGLRVTGARTTTGRGSSTARMRLPEPRAESPVIAAE